VCSTVSRTARALACRPPAGSFSNPPVVVGRHLRAPAAKGRPGCCWQQLLVQAADQGLQGSELYGHGCGETEMHWCPLQLLQYQPGAPGAPASGAGPPVVAETVLSTASSRFSAALSWACSQLLILSTCWCCSLLLCSVLWQAPLLVPPVHNNNALLGTCGQERHAQTAPCTPYNALGWVQGIQAEARQLGSPPTHSSLPSTVQSSLHPLNSCMPTTAP
jgi:hypothetical protein